MQTMTAPPQPVAGMNNNNSAAAMQQQGFNGGSQQQQLMQHQQSQQQLLHQRMRMPTAAASVAGGQHPPITSSGLHQGMNQQQQPGLQAMNPQQQRMAVAAANGNKRVVPPSLPLRKTNNDAVGGGPGFAQSSNSAFSQPQAGAAATSTSQQILHQPQPQQQQHRLATSHIGEAGMAVSASGGHLPQQQVPPGQQQWTGSGVGDPGGGGGLHQMPVRVLPQQQFMHQEQQHQLHMDALNNMTYNNQLQAPPGGGDHPDNFDPTTGGGGGNSNQQAQARRYRFHASKEIVSTTTADQQQGLQQVGQHVINNQHQVGIVPITSQPPTSTVQKSSGLVPMTSAATAMAKPEGKSKTGSQISSAGLIQPRRNRSPGPRRVGKTSMTTTAETHQQPRHSQQQLLVEQHQLQQHHHQMMYEDRLDAAEREMELQRQESINTGVTMDIAEEVLTLAHQRKTLPPSAKMVDMLPKHPVPGSIYVTESSGYAVDDLDDGYSWAEIVYQPNVVTRRNNSLDYRHFYIMLKTQKPALTKPQQGGGGQQPPPDIKEEPSSRFRKECFTLKKFTLLSYSGEVISPETIVNSSGKDKARTAKQQQGQKGLPQAANSLANSAFAKGLTSDSLLPTAAVASSSSVHGQRSPNHQQLKQAGGGGGPAGQQQQNDHFNSWPRKSAGPSKLNEPNRGGRSSAIDPMTENMRQQLQMMQMHGHPGGGMGHQPHHHGSLNHLNRRSPLPPSLLAEMANPHGDLMKVAQELAAGKVVKNLTVFPSLQITLLHPDMTKEFERCCRLAEYSSNAVAGGGGGNTSAGGTLINSSIKLFYDTTFAMGKYYVTLLTFANSCCEGNPVMPLAVNIHEAKFKSSHQLFWARIVGDLPMLQKYRFPLLIDDAEPAVHLAVRTQAPNLVQLEAWSHRFRDIDSFLRQRGYGDEAVHYYKTCIAYLLRSSSKQSMHDRYRKEFEHVWPKDFIFYYRQRLLPRSGRLGRWAMAKLRISDEDFLSPYSNPQDNFHDMCRNFTGWQRLTADQIVRAFYFLFLFYVAETGDGRIFALKREFQRIVAKTNDVGANGSALANVQVPHPSKIRDFVLRNFPKLNPVDGGGGPHQPGGGRTHGGAASVAMSVRSLSPWMAAYGTATESAEIFHAASDDRLFGGGASSLRTQQYLDSLDPRSGGAGDKMEDFCDIRTLENLLRSGGQGGGQVGQAIDDYRLETLLENDDDDDVFEPAGGLGGHHLHSVRDVPSPAPNGGPDPLRMKSPKTSFLGATSTTLPSSSKVKALSKRNSPLNNMTANNGNANSLKKTSNNCGGGLNNNQTAAVNVTTANNNSIAAVSQQQQQQQQQNQQTKMMQNNMDKLRAANNLSTIPELSRNTSPLSTSHPLSPPPNQMSNYNEQQLGSAASRGFFRGTTGDPSVMAASGGDGERRSSNGGSNRNSAVLSTAQFSEELPRHTVIGGRKSLGSTGGLIQGNNVTGNNGGGASFSKSFGGIDSNPPDLMANNPPVGRSSAGNLTAGSQQQSEMNPNFDAVFHWNR